MNGIESYISLSSNRTYHFHRIVHITFIESYISLSSFLDDWPSIYGDWSLLAIIAKSDL